MKKGVFTFVAVIILIIVAVLTNPNQDRHKEVLKNKLHSYMQQSMMGNNNSSSDELGTVGNAIALMLGGAIVDQILETLVSTDNYVVFSTTKITWNGESKIIGIGAFGNVYLTEELNRALDEGLLKNKQ